MNKKLKKLLQELVSESVAYFRHEKTSLLPKRIVLFTSIPIKDPIMVFNFTENRLLTERAGMNIKIPIARVDYYIPLLAGQKVDEVEHIYKDERYEQEGDYKIDVGVYLQKKGIKSTDFY